jgi:hypothetical protein
MDTVRTYGLVDLVDSGSFTYNSNPVLPRFLARRNRRRTNHGVRLAEAGANTTLYNEASRLPSSSPHALNQSF